MEIGKSGFLSLSPSCDCILSGSCSSSSCKFVFLSPRCINLSSSPRCILHTVLLGKRKKVVLNTKLNLYVTARQRPAHPSDEHTGPDFTTFAPPETGGRTNQPDTTAALAFVGQMIQGLSETTGPRVTSPSLLRRCCS
jgi:hypothetical protein